MKKYGLWLILGIWSVCVHAADYYMFKHIEVKDGLSNNMVTDIFKDSRGYMWFGTASGLNRYDGNRMTSYQSYDDNGPFADNYIRDIQEDRDGNLWIGTNSGNYSIYDVEKESFSREIRGVMWEKGINGTPQRVFIDKNKNMWFYIYGKGVYFYVPETNLLFPLLYETGLPQGEVTDMAECSEGVLLAFNDGKVVCVDRTNNKVKWDLPAPEKDKYEQFTLYVDRDDDIWVYSSSRVRVYNLLGKKWLDGIARTAKGKATDMVRSVYHSRSGKIWIGRDQEGVCVLDKKTGEYSVLTHIENDERSLQNNSVVSLYEDMNGIMWVGTYKKGVSYYSESTFKFGVNHVGDVNCVAEDKDGYLWIGTNDEGLIRWHRTKGVDKHLKSGGANSLSSDVIVALKKARDGKLWIGTFKGGLNCYDNGKFTHYKNIPGKTDCLANDNVFAVDEDRQGNIWIGTLGGGVQCLNPKTGKFTTYTTKEGLFSDYISSVQVGRDNQLLIGTAYGLSILDLESLQIANFHGPKSGNMQFTDFNLNQVFQDSRGLLWIATREGLNVFDLKTDALTILSEEDGLSSQFVTGIAEDDNKNIWVATAKGMTNVIPVVDTQSGKYAFRFYTYSDMDGLQNCEFNMRSLKKLSNGELMIGGMYGVNYFHPDNIRYNKVLPKVIFTQFSLFNEPVKIGQEYGKKVILDKTLDVKREVELAYDQNVFGVGFASDNFILPEKMRYAYKLEGFSQDWLSTTQEEVTYTNLSPGTYTLKVKAINSDGYSGDEEATMKIVIKPPFWMTTWAYVVYILLLGVLVWTARHLMLRSERNKFKMQQMQQEADKNKEINDMKLHFFTNVSHELRTPLTLIISPIESLMKEYKDDEGLQKKLGMMHRNATRLLNLVNQLLDFRRGDEKGHQLEKKEGDIVLFTQNMCNSFSDMTEKKHVHLTFFSAVPSLSMAFDDDKYGKVVMNLLSNAFKFTPENGRVDVSMHVVKNEAGGQVLELKVADTGVGIKDEDKQHIFERFYQVDAQSLDITGSGVGLSLVSEFVRLHGGTVKVMDNVPCGSIFMVQLPITGRSVITQPAPVADSDEEVVVIKSTLKEAPAEEPAVVEKAAVEEPAAKPATVIPVEEPEEKENDNLPLALIVDDNEDFLNFMAETLSEDYRVRTALNGRQAWEMIPSLMPDIIVSDVMMPEMDGNQLCKLVKSDKHTAQIPFILLTSCQSDDYKVQGLTVGADDYITKPFNIDVLMLRIRKLVRMNAHSSQRSLIEPEPSEIVITSMDEKLIDHAVKYVEDNIARSDLSVEELSHELGMSRVHLYKKLVSITGKTPIEFIRVIRLKRAAQLLRQSQQNVSEIAYQVGFNNPKYFSKYFKEEFGMLPSVYQNSDEK